jgi:hypothetical protein
MQCDPNALSQSSSALRAMTEQQLVLARLRTLCAWAAAKGSMIDCSAQGLATASACYECAIYPGLVGPAQVMLLAQIRAALIPGASTDPSFIANEARCFDCGFGNYAAEIVFLECAIANAVGA